MRRRRTFQEIWDSAVAKEAREYEAHLTALKNDEKRQGAFHYNEPNEKRKERQQRAAVTRKRTIRSQKGVL